MWWLKLIKLNRTFGISILIFPKQIFKMIGLLLCTWSQKFASSKINCPIMVKGTIMQIWKSANIPVFNRKILCRRFHIKTPFTFWDMRAWDMLKICLQIFRNNRICQKLAYVLRNAQTSRANISRILLIKNAKFSGYYFYMKTSK